MSERAEAIHRIKAAGPAGAAALAVVVAVVGGTMMTRKSAETPVIPAITGSVSPAAASDPRLQPAASQADAAPGATQSGPDPASTPPRGPALAGPAFDQTAASTGRPALSSEIVVKFKDDKKVKDMVDTFWKDASSARQKFESFKAGRPEFAGVALDRVTYSNELVLVPTGGNSASAVRDLASKMGKVSDISYAEANVTAKPVAR